MRTLIIYYSFSGNNELLARHLARRLRCPSEAVVERKKRRPLTILLDLALKRRPAIEDIRASPDDFDHVLFLAPLWNKGIAHPMVSALVQLREALPAYSFVTLCGSGRRGQHEHVARELEQLIGKAPRHVWDLHVEDLVARDQHTKRGAVTGRHVAAEDLAAFRDVIEDIVRSLEPAGAGSAAPDPDAA